MNYAAHMQETAHEHFDRLYAGIKELVFTDFPDYANVGDSAIALGQLQYFKRADIRVKSTHSIPSLHRSVLHQTSPVMLNGGGSIAGLYPVIDEHRYKLAQELRAETLLIQAPQSVHFANEGVRKEFMATFAARKRLRLAVRDDYSLGLMRGQVQDLHICPDAVHHLGTLLAPPPVQQLVVLARTDMESVSAPIPSPEPVDWLKDDLASRIGTAYRWRTEKVRMRLPLTLSNERWQKKAEKRLRRGISILAKGETVVTDRLHAMLISLQMGRRVIAVDNSTKKLSNYAETWLEGSHAKLSFAPDLAAAVDIAKSA